MIRSIRACLLLSAATLALTAAPVVLNATPLSDLSAFAGGKGNGNGGGNSGDHGNSGNSGEKGNSGNSGGSSNGNGASQKVADTELTTTTKANGKSGKVKNLNAQLAGLNSLNRNINGLMNSSDPRMELVREYITNGAALEQATADLEAAQGTLTDLKAALDTYAGDYVTTAALASYDGSFTYTGATVQTLNDRLAVLNDPLVTDLTNVDALAERDALVAALTAINGSAEGIAVSDQQTVVDGLTSDVADLGDATTEDALKAALLAAANKNRVAAVGEDAYLTPEIMAWATAKIDSLVADYAAQQ